MRTPEERIRALHARMEELTRARERRKTGFLGAGSVLLALCLVLVISASGMPHLGGTATMYGGATLLYENAGGYVLVAVLAFMAGAIITAVLLKQRFRDSAHSRQKEEVKK